jgi:hypothetical protein
MERMESVALYIVVEDEVVSANGANNNLRGVIGKDSSRKYDEFDDEHDEEEEEP